MSLTLNVEGGQVVVVDHDDDGNPTLSVSGSTVTLSVEHAGLLVDYLTAPPEGDEEPADELELDEETGGEAEA